MISHAHIPPEDSEKRAHLFHDRFRANPSPPNAKTIKELDAFRKDIWANLFLDQPQFIGMMVISLSQSTFMES